MMLLIFVINLFSQTTNLALSNDYCLKKSKHQKTVGWILLELVPFLQR